MQQHQLVCLNNGDAMGYSEVGTQSLNLMFQNKDPPSENILVVQTYPSPV